MPEKPLIGAAMMLSDYDVHRDLMRQLPRDVEIQDFCLPGLLDGDWRDRAERGRDLLRGHEGRIGIHGPFWGFSIAAQDSLVREVVRKRLMQGLDACELLGATQMVVHSPFTTWDHNNLDMVANARADLIGRVLDTMGEVVRRAENQGVVLVIENIEDKDTRARVALADAFGSPAVAVSIDTGHAFYAHRSTGAPPVDYYVRAAGDRLQHVHLQDADGYADRHWSIGDGDINWRTVFEALQTVNSNPRLMVELRDRSRIPDSIRYLQQIGLGR